MNKRSGAERALNNDLYSLIIIKKNKQEQDTADNESTRGKKIKRKHAKYRFKD